MLECVLLKAIGYIRVSTAEQGRSGLGLEAQESVIRSACDTRGWDLIAIERDVESGQTTRRRDGLANARKRLIAGEADVLVVAKLDRLSRSVLDFGTLLCEAADHGYAVTVLDPDVDLATPNGRLVARIICSVAEWEREMIATRTREALAVRRAQGVRMGRTTAIPDPVVSRVIRERRAGATLAAIADRLNADQVPTPHGGTRWRPSSIQRIVRRIDDGD